MDTKKRKAKRKHNQQRNTIIVIILTIAAIVIAYFASKDMYFSDPSSEAISDAAPSSGRAQNLQGEIERFFGGVRDSAWARNGGSQWVVELEKETRSLEEVLFERAQMVREPLDYSWRGDIRSRWFLEGDSLKTTAEKLAEAEGLNLIWWLDKDYIVRATFEVYSDMVNSMDRLARSLNAQHADEVEGYLCPRQRAILIAGSEQAAKVSEMCRSIRSLASR